MELAIIILSLGLSILSILSVINSIKSNKNINSSFTKIKNKTSIINATFIGKYSAGFIYSKEYRLRTYINNKGYFYIEEVCGNNTDLYVNLKQFYNNWNVIEGTPFA